jgi:hypothetical protein
MLPAMRRNDCDPLGDNRRPHWLTVSDLHRNLIACEALPAGGDLRAALREALARWAAEGWLAENDGAYGFVFIARGEERRLVNLTPADPAGVAGAGHAFLAGPCGLGSSVDSAGLFVTLNVP